MKLSFASSRLARLAACLALPFVLLPSSLRADCGTTCGTGESFQVTYFAQAVVKNGSVSMSLSGGTSVTKDSQNTDVEELVITPTGSGTIVKNQETGGSATVNSDLFASGCFGQMSLSFGTTNTCGLKLEVCSKRSDESSYSEWKAASTIKHDLNFAVNGARTVDFKLRLVPEDDNGDDEEESPDDSDDGGGDSGGGSPDIPSGQEDTPPSSPGGQPTQVVPASFHSSFTLGKGLKGSTTGATRISGPLTSSLASVSNLQVFDYKREPSFEIVKSGANVRQVFTSVWLVDVQPSGSGFELRYYKSGDFSTTKNGSGLFPINGGASPFQVIRYLPVAAAAGHNGGVRVVHVSLRGTTYTRDVVSTGTDGLGYKIIDENGLRTVDVSSVFEYVNNGWERSDSIVETRDGVSYSKQINTYRYLVNRPIPMGPATEIYRFLISSSRFVNGTESLTTTYVPIGSGVHFGKLYSVTNPDGSWTRYSYYAGTGSEQPGWRGLTKQIFRPWKDGPAAPGDATVNNSEVTTITYDPILGDHGHEEIGRTTTLPSGGAAITVAKAVKSTVGIQASEVSGLMVTAGIDPTWVPEAFEVEDRSIDRTGRDPAEAVDLLLSKKLYYRYQWPTRYRWDSRQCLETNEIGWGTVTGYQRGTLSGGSFSVDTTATELSSAPNIQRIDAKIINGSFVAGESTRTITYTDLAWRVLRRELWIYDGTTPWSLASATTYEYPTLWLDGSIREVIVKKDGRVIDHAYQTSGTELHVWDEQGIETVTTVDLIGRHAAQTLIGISGQPNRATSYGYSGRTTTEIVSGGTLSLTTVRRDDLAGRRDAETNPQGAVTRYAYPNNGRDTSVTLPGGLSRLIVRGRDGRVTSETGSAVVDVVYERTVLSSGNVATKVKTGDIADSPRYRTTENDWIGRTVKVTTPSPTGVGEVSTVTAFEPVIGLLSSVTSPAGTTLYRRPLDIDSSLAWYGKDVNSDGALSETSNDRVTETRSYYSLEGGYWWGVRSEKRYDTSNSSATAVASVSKVCLHGQPNGDAGKSISISPTGETVTTVVTVNRTTKTRTTTQSTTGLTSTAVAVDVNGLTISRKNRDTTAAATYSFDDLGRVIREVSPRGKVTARDYFPDGSLKSVTDHTNKTTTYSYHGPSSPSAGKLAGITNPDWTTKNFKYSALGQIEEEAGTAAYKVTYEYDGYGAKKKMFTWRDATTSDATEWIYQPGTGLLQSKKDAANQSVSYTYHASGKVATRTWARGVVTTYTYTSLGDLDLIDYPAGTPDVKFNSYDRLGRPTQVTTGSDVEKLTYFPGRPELKARYYTETHSLLPGRGIRYSLPDTTGASTGYDETYNSHNSTPNVVRTVSYGYDNQGRLDELTDGGQSVVYTYHADSSLIATVVNKTGTPSTGTSWFQESRYHDIPGRLTGIRSKRLGTSTNELTTYAYDYDSLGRRVKATFQDGSSWNYGYNNRSEVTSATRKNAAGTEITPLNSSYTYDGIGNRLTANSGVMGYHGYEPNSLNQYGTVTTGDSRTAVGRADSSWPLSVDGIAVAAGERIGDIYYKTLGGIANSSNPVWKSVITKRSSGTPAASFTNYFWYAKATTTPAYDADGNLLSDGRNGSTDEGRWVYTWDAENRLIKMESTAKAVTAGMSYTRLTFQYNWEGKRIARHVWRGGSAVSPVFLNSRRWVYDGWNPVVEFTGTSATAQTGLTAAALNRYTWGLDLGDAGEGVARPGQMLQRAGGVGGLLLQTTVSGGVLERPSYDGNGNIVAWTKSNGTAPTSRREYDAFGNVVMSEGASPSAFGFSTRIEDAQTGLLYYGYRYYQPEQGRWLSRDPIGENGGENLYGFVENYPINTFDVSGLRPYHDTPGGIVDTINPIPEESEEARGQREEREADARTRERRRNNASCCTADKIKEGEDELNKKYDKQKKITPAPRGTYFFENEGASCHELATAVLNSLTPLPDCWECKLVQARRDIINGGGNHWWVECTAFDQNGGNGKTLIFDAYRDLMPGSPGGADNRTTYPNELPVSDADWGAHKPTYQNPTGCCP
ncbi:RHS repeat domain-containing protein [Luteolibacter luteus]|uniref:RHS repeat-associated core domain-containing protein n=1 Tax=Luteolibacter luteus TaxID=2728835 RepID=A0A858RHH9_9BACT|nr:RHS repeat-associated core domain-containing protein [Luteolibacter luteus]QJE95720.1 RHS repeat-associated core domain-containing protein [Luteolibacter luteus]